VRAALPVVVGTSHGIAIADIEPAAVLARQGELAWSGL